MSYKCRICGVNDVDRPGDICELCALSQDPYANSMTGGQGGGTFGQTRYPWQNGGSSSSSNDTYVPSRGSSRRVLLGGGSTVANTDPYGNDMTSAGDPVTGVQVYKPGQAPADPGAFPTAPAAPAAPSIPKGMATSGIIKNVATDKDQLPAIGKWFRAMFSGVPFTTDDDMTLFQVYPDYSGSTLTASGNACDQVVIYGHVAVGAICENNEVEVYGGRNTDNVIVANRIKNIASGTTVTPQHTMSPVAVWIVTLLVIGIVYSVVSFAVGAVNGISVNPRTLMYIGIGILVVVFLPQIIPMVFRIAGSFIKSIFRFISDLFGG